MIEKIVVGGFLALLIFGAVITIFLTFSFIFGLIKDAFDILNKNRGNE